MERFTIDFSLPNFITIGVVGAIWFLVIVGGYSVWAKSQAASS